MCFYSFIRFYRMYTRILELYNFYVMKCVVSLSTFRVIILKGEIIFLETQKTQIVIAMIDKNPLTDNLIFRGRQTSRQNYHDCIRQ